MFYQVLLSSQVKRSAIISNKYDIYVLPHELPNDLRLRILENGMCIMQSMKYFIIFIDSFTESRLASLENSQPALRQKCPNRNPF